MLTKDLVRFKLQAGQILPQFVQPRGKLGEWCEQLLATWQQSIGLMRDDVDEHIQPLLYRLRSLQVAKGMNKLVTDGADFQEPAHCAENRWQMLLASAESLRNPAASGSLQQHRETVATALDVPVDSIDDDLYADLPMSAVLRSAPQWSVGQLVAAYNMALVQGLLIHADAIQVWLPEMATAARRSLLKAIAVGIGCWPIFNMITMVDYS